MAFIPAPQPVDLDAYTADNPDVQPFYGLPREIHFCARCTYSSQKPNSEKEYQHSRATKKPTVAFDEEGVCSACRIAEVKDNIRWDDRRRELEELCDRYRRDDGHYDVLVPGSGGKDSFYAAWVLKHEFGMHPLTVTWAPHIYTDWGWKNFAAWIQAGFDNYLFTPNGRVHRLMTRLAIETLFHPFQPFIMGQMYFPPKLAAQLGIPLVFYGENPTEYGNAAGDNAKSKKDWDYISTADRSEIYLAGTSLRELVEDFGLSAVDLDPYLPPDPQLQRDRDIDIRYLGYYLKWHPQTCYYYAVEHGGFRAAPERTLGTYSKYSSIDDKIDDFHYYTTFIKFGIGRATYDTAQEIRNGDITRDEGLALVKRYDGEYPDRFDRELFQYLSLPEAQFPVASTQFEEPIMDRDYFDRLTSKFRSPHLWRWDGEQFVLRKRAFDSESVQAVAQGSADA